MRLRHRFGTVRTGCSSRPAWSDTVANREDHMTSFVLEVSNLGPHTESTGVNARGAGALTTERAIEGVASTIVEACSGVFERARAGLEAAMPDELTVEFGVSLTGEGGIPFVGKASAESTFKVTAKWSLSGPS